MLIDINKIQIEDRIRKDYGDIEELAKDIKENGLINPPVITPDNVLIAGERRTRACKFLGYEQIEVRVMTVKNALHQLKLEISENENRKDFSFSEKMQWAKQLKNEYSKIAKENQGNRNDLTSDKNLSKVDSNKNVANEVGFGNKETFRQAQYISENGDEELIKKLDEGQLSINKAYKTLKQKKEELEQEKDTLKRQLILEKNKEPKIQTIDKTDYKTIEKLKQEINEMKSTLTRKQQENLAMRSQLEMYKSDSEEYEKMKNDIELLTSKKDDLGRQIDSITSISGLVVDINHLIKDKLAPIKYSKALLEAKNEDIVINNLSEIVNVVQSWCDEMKQYLPNEIEYVEVM